MTKVLRTTAAAAAFSIASLGMLGVALAEDDSYTPPVCTEVVDGVETAVPCDPATEAAVVSTGAEAAEVAGTLPYTGNDSSLPLAEAGVALLAGGGVLLMVVKRRQAAHDA